MKKNNDNSKITEFPAKGTVGGLSEVRRKNSRRKRVTFYRVSLVVLIISSIIIGYFIYQDTKVYKSYTVKSSVVRETIEGTKMLEFDGGVLSYSKNGAGAADANGKLLWNIAYDMQNPLMSACDDTAAFADYGGRTIYIQTTAGKTSTVSTDKPIRKIAVSSAGYVIAVLEDTSVTWIYMYDSNGSEISFFRTSMEKSGYPIDIDISNDGELVAVSYYYVDCNDIRSSVAFYNFGSVGQNYIDNYVSGYNYSDTMMPIVRFLDNHTAFAASGDRLCIFEGAHKPVSISEMFISDDLLSVYYCKDAIAAIYRNGDYDTKYRLEVYNKNGKIASKKVFSFEYTGVTFGNGNVILYGESDIYIATYGGDLKYSGNYSTPIKLVIPTKDQTRYVVVTQNTMDMIEFK